MDGHSCSFRIQSSPGPPKGCISCVAAVAASAALSSIVGTQALVMQVHDHAGPREVDVGITAFANDASPFSAILRHRIADFQVNEISLDMEVAAAAPSQVPLTAKEPTPSWRAPEAAQRAEQMVTAFEAQHGKEHAQVLRAFVAQLTGKVLLPVLWLRATLAARLCPLPYVSPAWARGHA